MPLIYPIVIVQYGLNAGDIGTFIAITTAVGGTMQLAYGFLTRLVARPTLLAGGQLLFGASLVAGGLAQSVVQLLASFSVMAGSYLAAAMLQVAVRERSPGTAAA